MRSMRFGLAVAAAALGCPGAWAVDPRVCALRARDTAALKAILIKVKESGKDISYDEAADAESLRALLYEYMQGEIPGNTQVLPWPGPGTPGECDSAPKGKAATGQAGAGQGSGTMTEADMSKVAKQMFQKQDSDQDGKLTRAEMQSMLDSVNAAARAKGEAEHDLFSTLDVNKDGVVEFAEAEKQFAAMMRSMMSKGGGSGGSAKPQQGDSSQLADGLFQSLDKDGDGRLSKDEFSDVLEKYQADAKAKGEAADEDFWGSLDADSDGFINREEASGFIAAMVAAVSGGQKDEL